MIRLAIVSPCYNEEAVLHDSAARLTALLTEQHALGRISADSYIAYVNDGSRDRTWPIIQELHAGDSRVTGINLTHNVGHQNAIMAGMMTVLDRCDACITIDADLQDDLAAIPQMIDRMAEGNDIVYGVKVSREADSLMKKFTAQAFYRIQGAMGVKTVYNHADFRLLSNRALHELSLYHERNLYLRGLMPLLGLPSATVDDVLSPRKAGESKYTLGKMLRLAADGITSFSIQPIMLIMGVGGFGMMVCAGILIYVLTSFLTGHTVPGWTSLMLSLWFIGSALLLSIGTIGIYIGKIYIEVKQRPLYSIGEVLGSWSS